MSRNLGTRILLFIFVGRFIAERGDGGQLRHVENIDGAFNLKPLPVVVGEKKPTQKLDIGRLLPVTAQTPRLVDETSPTFTNIASCYLKVNNVKFYFNFWFSVR